MMKKPFLFVFLIFFFSISVYSAQAEGLSLKQQLEEGTSLRDIVCDEGLELIFKSTDFSPACVKPSTAEVLLDRQWNIFDKNQIEISTDKLQYQFGDVVKITLKNVGTHSAFFGSSAFGVFIADSSGEIINTCRGSAPAITELRSNEQITRTWTTEIDCKEEVIPQGEYGIFVIYNLHPKLELPLIETQKQIIMIT